MIKIERFVTMSPEQYDIVIQGMRNPLNSWDRSDSYMTHVADPETLVEAPTEYFIGDNDLHLMTRLAAGGSVHAKYRRMMPVWITINAPLYWWKEFDTYKVGTVANSCSTMHTIQKKQFELGDFSWEYLDEDSICALEHIIDELNTSRNDHAELTSQLQTTEAQAHPDIFDEIMFERKLAWWQMIQLLPSSFNQKRTVFLNYEVLHNMYHSRLDHKLDEWREFCQWIKTLPYSELITK